MKMPGNIVFKSAKIIHQLKIYLKTWLRERQLHSSLIEICFHISKFQNLN